MALRQGESKAVYAEMNKQNFYAFRNELFFVIKRDEGDVTSKGFWKNGYENCFIDVSWNFSYNRFSWED